MEIRKLQRKVLLAVREDHVDGRLLAVACSLCQRIEAELDILVRVRGDVSPTELQEFIATLQGEGVAYTLSLKPMMRRRDIVLYANSHECIATVVIDSLEGWEGVAEDRASDPWGKLACPLVTAVPPKT
ncbi:MAG: hypothetical protein Q8M20_01390 [Rhodocyclaceae bacterium]|nr:hypothetical protein [Rhodocyclaceae bacterium]MDZ4214850.1 hypothetical protein [Rhodocyclaceae bacterium]